MCTYIGKCRISVSGCYNARLSVMHPSTYATPVYIHNKMYAFYCMLIDHIRRFENTDAKSR